LDLRGRKGWEAEEGYTMRSFTIYTSENVTGRDHFERSRRRWEDNIRIDLREIGWEDVNWMHLDRDRNHWGVLVNTAMNLRVP
jgi:hypothetical protein